MNNTEFISLLKRTPNDILNNIFSRMENVDTRPSSANYQSVGPIAYELKNISLLIEWMMKQTYIATADGEYLDILAEQFQFTRETAKTVIVKAEIIGNDVPIGNRFASLTLENSIIYRVIENIGSNIYYLEAEELNPQANYYIGNLEIIDFIPDLVSAKIIEIILPQKESENDETFRKRIQENLIAEASDGNIAQYKKWLSEIEGVGKSKITSLWNGPNTVKCTILNELNQKASPELIEKVQNFLDPNSEGLGEGKAPIGAIVTVDTGIELRININVSVEYKQGQTSAPTLRQELIDFFGEIAFDRTVISYLQIAGAISNNKNIDFITSLTVNGQKDDIRLSANQIAVLGDLNVN